jgi:hypothetical protein
MFYLIQFHWVWLLLALLLGVAIGWTTCGETSDGRFGSWISTAAVAFVVALIVGLLRLLPGRLGYWLDMALITFATYIVGCCIGCWLKRQLDPDPAAVGSSAAGPRSSGAEDAGKDVTRAQSSPT